MLGINTGAASSPAGPARLSGKRTGRCAQPRGAGCQPETSAVAQESRKAYRLGLAL